MAKLKISAAIAAQFVAARALSESGGKYSKKRVERRRLMAEVRKQFPALGRARLLIAVENPANPLYCVIRDLKTGVAFDDGQPEPVVMAPAAVAAPLPNPPAEVVVPADVLETPAKPAKPAKKPAAVKAVKPAKEAVAKPVKAPAKTAKVKAAPVVAAPAKKAPAAAKKPATKKPAKVETEVKPAKVDRKAEAAKVVPVKKGAAVGKSLPPAISDTAKPVKKAPAKKAA